MAKLQNLQGHYGEFYYNGIDRKDNFLGYTLSNVVTCCKKCNFLKRDMSYIDFINYIKQIYLTLEERCVL